MRIILCLLVATLSLAASVWAAMNGLAGEQFHDSSRMYWAYWHQADRTGRHPDAAALASLERQVSHTLSWMPGHGALWLNLELIARLPREIPGGAVVENELLARQAAEAALVRLPHSPVAWAEYARVLDLLNAQGRIADGNSRLNVAVRQALRLGPRELSMQLGMVDLGLRNWDGLDRDTREALARAVSGFSKSRKDAALAAAMRRGRVAELCAFVVMRTHAGCIARIERDTEAAPAGTAAAAQAASSAS